MDEVPILGRDSDQQIFNEIAAYYDVPAYIRRARNVQNTLDQMMARCRVQREEWLSLVRTRLGLLHALAGDWPVLRPYLADDAQLEGLCQLHAELQPRLRAKIAVSTSPGTLQRGLEQLIESMERFNRRWLAFLTTVDLMPVNAAREGYNRYYVLEKECAVRSIRLAQQGFRHLEMLTLEELTGLLPPLLVPLRAASV